MLGQLSCMQQSTCEIFRLWLLGCPVCKGTSGMLSSCGVFRGTDKLVISCPVALCIADLLGCQLPCVQQISLDISGCRVNCPVGSGSPGMPQAMLSVTLSSMSQDIVPLEKKTS